MKVDILVLFLFLEAKIYAFIIEYYVSCGFFIKCPLSWWESFFSIPSFLCVCVHAHTHVCFERALDFVKSFFGGIY